MVSNQKVFFIHATNLWLQRKRKYNLKPEALQTSLNKRDQPIVPPPSFLLISSFFFSNRGNGQLSGSISPFFYPRANLNKTKKAPLSSTPPLKFPEKSPSFWFSSLSYPAQKRPPWRISFLWLL